MVTFLVCSALDLLTSVLEEEPPIYYPNRCPKINVQPYLAPRLVYQYLDEEPVTIESEGGVLSWTTQDIFPDNTLVHAFGTYLNKSNKCNQLDYWRTSYPVPTPLGELATDNRQISWGMYYPDSAYGLYFLTSSEYNSSYLGPLPGTRTIYYRATSSDCYNVIRRYGDSPEVIFIVPVGNPEVLCEFTVKEEFFDNDGNLYRTDIRHQETRNVCPDVEEFSCDLGEVQTLDLKLDSLEALLATTSSEFALQNGTLLEGFDIAEIINFLAGNPDNCLLIWKIKRSFGVLFSIEQIAQICSPKDCPPPEYN